MGAFKRQLSAQKPGSYDARALLDLPGASVACSAVPWLRLAAHFLHRSQRSPAQQPTRISTVYEGKRFDRGRQSISGSLLKCHQLLDEAAASANGHSLHGACNMVSQSGR